MRKRHFTLLEVLISLTCLMMLLGILTFFYRYIDLLNRKTDREQQELFKDIYVENRLAHILPAIGREQCFTTDNSLYFIYDNGESLDKLYGCNALGKITLTQQNELVLYIWPHPKRWGEIDNLTHKKEVLYTGAEKIEWDFFSGEHYSSTWPKERKEIPAIIRITLSLTDGGQKQFAFVLPHATKKIEL